MARTTKAQGVLSRPLEKGSVVRLVLERIKEAMLSKELRRGDYLPSETELTRSLGVGKTSVREAIKMLEAMGIVEVRQGHGTIIREQASDESLGPLVFQLILEQATNENLLELRRLFEPAYTLLAMEKATDEDVLRLQAQVAGFEQRIGAGTQTSDDDLAFHRIVLECTRNPFVIQIGTTIHQLFKSSISRSMRTIADVALRDHKAILAAFAARDPEALRAAVFRSFEGWKRSLAST
jgi:GntR family transcriptional regulator, transcriptional repressor for pyruvate dehydrogenase complex